MPLRKEEYWEFRHELEEAIQTHLDLHTQDDDPKIVTKILERGIVIYEVQS